MRDASSLITEPKLSLLDKKAVGLNFQHLLQMLKLLGKDEEDR